MAVGNTNSQSNVKQLVHQIKDSQAKPLPANTQVEFPITWDNAYANTDYLLSPYFRGSGNNWARLQWYVASKTTTGCVIRAYSHDAAVTSVHFTAEALGVLA